MTIRIEYENEIPKLRFANIYCPECGIKFDARENGKTEYGGRLSDCVDLQFGIYVCPHCKNKFQTRNMKCVLDEIG